MKKQARGYRIRARIYRQSYDPATNPDDYYIVEDIESARHAVSARIQYGRRMYLIPSVRFVVIESVKEVE